MDQLVIADLGERYSNNGNQETTKSLDDRVEDALWCTVAESGYFIASAWLYGSKHDVFPPSLEALSPKQSILNALDILWFCALDLGPLFKIDGSMFFMQDLLEKKMPDTTFDFNFLAAMMDKPNLVRSLVPFLEALKWRSFSGMMADWLTP